jgi:hypothetical protein
VSPPAASCHSPPIKSNFITPSITLRSEISVFTRSLSPFTTPWLLRRIPSIYVVWRTRLMAPASFEHKLGVSHLEGFSRSSPFDPPAPDNEPLRRPACIISTPQGPQTSFAMTCLTTV